MASPTILYVDDEPDALKAVSLGMQVRGFNLITANSGPEALELLKTVTPDLIITDLRMLPMNGFELFQEIKKDPRNQNIPFFFLTAVNDSLAQKYGQKLGVDAYLNKPVDLDDLVLAINNKLASQ